MNFGSHKAYLSKRKIMRALTVERAPLIHNPETHLEPGKPAVESLDEMEEEIPEEGSPEMMPSRRLNQPVPYQPSFHSMIIQQADPLQEEQKDAVAFKQALAKLAEEHDRGQTKAKPPSSKVNSEPSSPHGRAKGRGVMRVRRRSGDSASMEKESQENGADLHSDEADVAKDKGKNEDENEDENRRQIPARKKSLVGSVHSFIMVRDEQLDAFNSDKEENEEERKVPLDPRQRLVLAACESEEEKARIGKLLPLRGLAQTRGQVGKEHQQEVDTNVVLLDLSVLKNSGVTATGDPVVCTRCRAMLNVYSKVERKTEKQTWKCEFCGHENEVAVEPEEQPQSEDVTYIVESAQQRLSKKADGGEDVSVVFCVDTSGSMCVSKRLTGQQPFKHNHVDKLQELLHFGDGSLQYVEGESADQTYVSRLQCVQAAIEKQLRELVHGAPRRLVGLVTFSSEVTLFGDGTLPPKVITGDKLVRKEELTKIAAESEEYLKKPVRETSSALLHHIEALEEGGQTALGPALLLAVHLASRGKPGSKVILCTDGCANVGLGSIDKITKPAEGAEVARYYKELGELAKARGVTVSLVSIVGEDCRLEMLSPLADLTGGEILRVDPLNLAHDFADILAEQVVATDVELRVKLHRTLTFRNEEPQQLAQDGTLLVRAIGNANDKHEIPLEYRLKGHVELQQFTDLDLAALSRLPFQAQVSYTNLEGSRCVRLMTRVLEVTFEKEEAKRIANYDVLAVNAVQQTAKLAKEGRFREAQANAYQWKQVMRESAGYAEYKSLSAPLYAALQMQQIEDLSVPVSSSASHPAKRDYVVSHTSKARKITTINLLPPSS